MQPLPPAEPLAVPELPVLSVPSAAPLTVPRIPDLSQLTRANSLLSVRGLLEASKRARKQDTAVELALANTAEEFCRRLVARIVEFEKTLNEAEEVGLLLVSFGQTVTIHVRDLAYHNPSLIVFVGVTDDDNPVELVQHVSQISFLLMAVKRLKPDEDRSEMGFHSLFRELNSQS